MMNGISRSVHSPFTCGADSWAAVTTSTAQPFDPPPGYVDPTFEAVFLVSSPAAAFQAYVTFHLVGGYTSSVTYRLGVFAVGADAAAAQGSFTHVYVGRTSRRPVSSRPRINVVM